MSRNTGSIKEEGIVLRSIRHGESSRIITFFGKTTGKIAIMAKGARRGKSGATGGAITPGNHIEAIIHFKPSRSVQILGQVSVLKDFPAIQNDLIKSGYASATLELLQKCISDEEANEDLLHNVLYAFAGFNSANGLDPKIIFLRFQLELLSSIGFGLDPFSCPVCEKNPAETGLNNTLWMEAGAICCHSCDPEMGTRLKLTGEYVRILRLLSETESPILGRIRLSQSASKNLIGILEKFLRFHHPGLGSLPALRMLHKFEEPIKMIIPDNPKSETPDRSCK